MSVEIQKFVLRRLLQKNGEPVTASELKLAIRSAFSAVFTEGDLDNQLTQIVDAGHADMAKNDFDQITLALTSKGLHAAQRLVKLT